MRGWVGRTPLVVMVWVTLLVTSGGPVHGGSAGARRSGVERDGSRWEVPPAPAAPEARRRWALARMDETWAEQRRCRALLGANGVSGDFHIMRHAANLESTYTYEGTDQIHTLSIGRALTGFAAF